MSKTWDRLLKGVMIGCFIASVSLVAIPVIQDRIIYKEWLNDMREMNERGISPQTRGGAMGYPDTLNIDTIK